jgi:hypothetical protein
MGRCHPVPDPPYTLECVEGGFSEVRQELSNDHSFEGCVDLRQSDIIPVGKANSLGEPGKETILWHGT